MPTTKRALQMMEAQADRAIEEEVLRRTERRARQLTAGIEDPDSIAYLRQAALAEVLWSMLEEWDLPPLASAPRMREANRSFWGRISLIDNITAIMWPGLFMQFFRHIGVDGLLHHDPIWHKPMPRPWQDPPVVDGRRSPRTRGAPAPGAED